MNSPESHSVWLNLKYFGHLVQRVDSLEKPLMLGGIGGRRKDDRGWYGWMSSRTQWTWVWVNSRRRWWTGRPGVLRFMGSQRVRHDWATELNWTEFLFIYLLSITRPNRARARFPHSQSLPSTSFHKPLKLILQRADRRPTMPYSLEWKPQSHKANLNDPVDHTFV